MVGDVTALISKQMLSWVRKQSLLMNQSLIQLSVAKQSLLSTHKQRAHVVTNQIFPDG
jgi:hypothetical protein